MLVLKGSLALSWITVVVVLNITLQPMQMIFTNTRAVSNSYEFSLTLLSNSKACHRMQVKLERRPTMDILAPGNRGQRTQTQAHKRKNCS